MCIKIIFIMRKFIIPLILFSFVVLTNLLLSAKDFGKEEMTIFDKFYYSVISFTTVGFGDFYPISNKGKIISILQNSMILFVPLVLALNEDNTVMTKIISHAVILLVAFIMHSSIYKDKSINILTKLYQTFIVHSTIGYGDISPSSKIGKMINIIHPVSVYMLSFL